MEKKDSLYLYHREQKVKTLGPGERYIIWLQGCKHQCENCIAPETHSIDQNGEWIKIEQLIMEIKANKEIRGVTISGGEPFLQVEGLAAFVKKIRSMGLDIICYTGFKYEDLKKSKNKHITGILSEIDILIDGKYEFDKNTGSYLRGSDNQRIIHLKPTYKKYEMEMNELKSRNVEVKSSGENMIFFAGIPPIGLSEKYNEIVKKIYEEG